MEPILSGFGKKVPSRVAAESLQSETARSTTRAGVFSYQKYHEEFDSSRLESDKQGSKDCSTDSKGLALVLSPGPRLTLWWQRVRHIWFQRTEVSQLQISPGSNLTLRRTTLI